MRDYVISAVAGEMPAVYEPEALKAQAAASVTLTRYLQAKGPDETLGGAVISTDPKRHQGYLSVEEMHRRWGDKFSVYYARVSAAVDAVLPYTVTYKGAPAVTAFHAVSSGVTETAENVWGKAIPYLVNCESAGDKLSPGYLSEAVVSPEAFAEKLGLPETEDPPADWAGEGTYSEAGTLLKIRICSKSFTGADLREALSLRSAAVKLKFNGENFVLSVTGYGHGVGMSQYGADYYARQGMTWREIIAHYYPGTEIR
jgi:stage II sporulation protein D